MQSVALMDFRSWPGRDSVTVSLLARIPAIRLVQSRSLVLNLDRNLDGQLVAVSGPRISTWHLMLPASGSRVLPRQDFAILMQE